jgi:AraC family transcriptional regulator
MAGEGAYALSSQVELHFTWGSGYIDAETQSGRKIRNCANRTSYAKVLPPGTQVQFRVKEARQYQRLSLGLEREFLAGAAAFEGPANFDVSETWDYRDPLSWQLARLIHDECTSGAPQGILYTETAATLLAMHLVRSLSTATPLLKEIHRGGLPPSRLRCACDYMMSRLGYDISLQEVAASVGLSTGHFSTAFKQSLGIAPHAWLRRQRIDRAKALLHNRSLDLASIALIVGFANQSAFGVAFKKETGFTPTAWRRLHWL